MKFESSTPTDMAESPNLHDSNGTGSQSVKNGILKETTNGVSSSLNGNGTTVRNSARFSDQFFGHSREEVTRLIIQALNDLGYR